MALDPSVQVHRLALCESSDVGPRTRVWAFAHVMEGAVIGADCNVCGHAFVEGGARIGDRVTIKNNVMVWDRVTVEDEVFLGPNAVLTNDRTPRAAAPPEDRVLIPTLIRRGATIGANATILCGLTIGRWAFVGAGAVVTHDVPDHVLVYGNPARPHGFMCRCGRKLTPELACAVCGAVYDPMEEGGLRFREAGAPIVGAPGRGARGAGGSTTIR